MTEDYENEGNFPDVRAIFMAIGPAFKVNHNHTWIKLVDEYQVMMHALCANATGKSLSEALIFASTYPQYNDRLFIEIHENSKIKLGEIMLCTEIVFDIQNNFVHNMFSPCFAERRFSDKDLPVQLIMGLGHVWKICSKMKHVRTAMDLLEIRWK